MYKKQMIFQKIICYLVLIASAVVFIYSLGFMTDLFDGLQLVAGDPQTGKKPKVPGTDILYTMQPFNRQLTAIGLVLILLSVLMLVMCTHTRRKYYAGNYISIALSVGANIYATVWCITNVFAYKAMYLTVIDFAELKEYLETRGKKDPGIQTFWFDACIPVFALLMVATALLVANLIWKIRVQNAENKLIKEGKEAA